MVVKASGIDIVVAVDFSMSMAAEDFEIAGSRANRVAAAKDVLRRFIEGRPNDRIGVVAFAGRAYVAAPLTLDHAFLLQRLEQLRLGLIEDGTAIGDGLGVALTRLEQAQRESGGRRQGAFVVLLTDGANNRGALTPPQAAEIAKARGIPVYTIGAGRDGIVPFPVFDEQGNKIGMRRLLSDLDESALRDIATTTGGRYFRAADQDTITAAFNAIDQAKKIEFQAKSYLVTTELFHWPAAPGLVALILGAVFARPPLRKEATA